MTAQLFLPAWLVDCMEPEHRELAEEMTRRQNFGGEVRWIEHPDLNLWEVRAE